MHLSILLKIVDASKVWKEIFDSAQQRIVTCVNGNEFIYRNEIHFKLHGAFSLTFLQTHLPLAVLAKIFHIL